MTRTVVSGFSISMDGFAAGPAQSLQNPLGVGGLDLHQWFFDTKSYAPMRGADAASAGIDASFGRQAMEGFGAYILGRHMYGPQHGEWMDDGWTGWWGPNPPWHGPTFILTHYPRTPIVMEGGTTYHFVTGGIHVALEMARQAAGPRNVKIGGGVSTVRQYLMADLVDDLHLAITPVLLGQGEPLFPGIDLASRGFAITGRAIGAHAMHITLSRSAPTFGPVA